MNKPMKICFMDLDDTLYQRSVPFMKTCEQLLPDLPAKMRQEAFKTCNVRGNEVFADSQTGKITMDEMYIFRYTKGFADVGYTITDVEALKFQEIYGQMQGRIELTDTVRRALKCASEAYDRIGIITNGPGEHQRAKLRTLGVEGLIDERLIFISGEMNLRKPDVEVFYHVQEQVKNLWPKMWEAGEISLTMVGDSYEHDILPALAAGWEAIHAPTEESLLAMMEEKARNCPAGPGEDMR